MGKDRRFTEDRRMYGERRIKNGHNLFIDHEKRNVIDRRAFTERRREKYVSPQVDLFQISI